MLEKLLMRTREKLDDNSFYNTQYLKVVKEVRQQLLIDPDLEGDTVWLDAIIRAERKNMESIDYYYCKV